MRISVMGLGYVGAVSAACLASDGHDVTGVDISDVKVTLINNGRSPVIEEGLDDLIRENVNAGRLRATLNTETAVQTTDLSLVCVGTPSKANGSLEDHYIRQVCREIGMAVRNSSKSHIVVLRSTMLPGTMRNVVLASLVDGYGGDIEGKISVAINPEFLRESTAISDYRNPPKTVVGSDDSACSKTVCSIYSKVSAPVFETSLEIAELAKYIDNTWHALKVTFANEVGTLCGGLNVDSHAVMDLFLADTKLNISSTYLRPGFAFGGSCLPKDVRALSYRARSLDVRLPVIENILESNLLQVEKAARLVASRKSRKVGILGLSFKPGTDDLRESPLVELVERLVGKGFDVRIYDSNVLLSRLLGANKEYLETMIPHVETLLVSSVSEVLLHADTIVVGHSTPDFQRVPGQLRADQSLIDLVRLPTRSECAGHYSGFSW